MNTQYMINVNSKPDNLVKAAAHNALECENAHKVTTERDTLTIGTPQLASQ